MRQQFITYTHDIIACVWVVTNLKQQELRMFIFGRNIFHVNIILFTRKGFKKSALVNPT